MEALWSEYTTATREQLDLVLYGERRGGDDDRAEANWKTIQEGLQQEKMDDAKLSEFAVAAGEYTREARKEFLESDLTDGYQGRDHILAERVDNMENTLLIHTLETIAERSHHYSLPTTGMQSYDQHTELAQLGRGNRWAEIPARIRDMSQRG